MKQTKPAMASKNIYQCSHCFTMYDELLGDVENNISAETPFKALPLTYRYALCDAGKEDFIAVEEAALKM